MRAVDLFRLPILPGRQHSFARWLAISLCSTGFPFVEMGCAQWQTAEISTQPPAVVARASADDEVLQLPAQKPDASPAAGGEPGMTTAAAAPSKILPINLDTVLHLAEVQNGQVAQARSRVDEAFAEKDLADKAWLPSLNIGAEYTRHEGGITDQSRGNFGALDHASFGTLFGGLDIYSKIDLRNAVFLEVNAERQVWQQKGELRRITSETLLDATSTYVDLLAVRTGEAIAVSLQKDLQDLVERAQKLANTEPGARVEVARIQAQLKGREQTIIELRSAAAQLSAKLAYLLGLDPCTSLVPVDERLVPLNMIDAGRPVCDLVAQALGNGPGVRELEGLLALVHQSMERAKGPGKYIPVFEMRMLEGGFGTGPGDRMDWDNRWDLGVQVRWNLTDLLTAGDRQRILQTKADQAHLAYQDLRSKLTLGVQESRETILGGKDRIRLGEEAISEARRAHQLSDDRLKNNVSGSSPSEVLLSLQAVAAAQASYIETIRTYDKAQLRLMVVLGLAGNSSVDGNCPNCCGKPQ